MKIKKNNYKNYFYVFLYANREKLGGRRKESGKPCLFLFFFNVYTKDKSNVLFLSLWVRCTIV